MRALICGEGMAAAVGADGVAPIHQGYERYVAASWSAERVWLLAEHDDEPRLICARPPVRTGPWTTSRDFVIDAGEAVDLLVVDDRVLVADATGDICDYPQRGRARPVRTTIADRGRPLCLVRAHDGVRVLCESDDGASSFVATREGVQIGEVQQLRGRPVAYAASGNVELTLTDEGWLYRTGTKPRWLDNRTCGGMAVYGHTLIYTVCDDDEPGCKLVRFTRDGRLDEIDAIEGAGRLRGLDAPDLAHVAIAHHLPAPGVS